MVKSKLDVVQWGTDRIRIGPWRGDARVAYLAPMAGQPASIDSIDHILHILKTKGFQSVITAALASLEQEAYIASGFVVHERLHLLRHRLDVIPQAPSHRSRRARLFDQTRVLEVDALAFDAFWRFDRQGLIDARTATPVSRFRVTDPRSVVGYAVTGKAGPIGYLQRIAVHPDHRHKGIATALVVDGLRWVRQRGGTSLLVNTQETNSGALGLYERLGFTHEPQGLAVLERSLVGSSPR